MYKYRATNVLKRIRLKFDLSKNIKVSIVYLKSKESKHMKNCAVVIKPSVNGVKRHRLIVPLVLSDLIIMMFLIRDTLLQV